MSLLCFRNASGWTRNACHDRQVVTELSPRVAFEWTRFMSKVRHVTTAWSSCAHTVFAENLSHGSTNVIGSISEGIKFFWTSTFIPLLNMPSSLCVRMKQVFCDSLICISIYSTNIIKFNGKLIATFVWFSFSLFLEQNYCTTNVDGLESNESKFLDMEHLLGNPQVWSWGHLRRLRDSFFSKITYEVAYSS